MCIYMCACVCVRNPLEAHLSSLDGWSLVIPGMVLQWCSLSTHTTHTRRIYSILIEFQFSISPFNWIQWKSVDETVFSALCASLTHSCPAVLALSPSSCLPVTRLMFSLLLLLFIQLLPLLGRRHQGSLVCQLWWRQRCRTNLRTHTHTQAHTLPRC